MAADRLADMARQGFMRGARVRAPRKKLHWVACEDCLNWHRQGRHTADAAARKANREARS